LLAVLDRDLDEAERLIAAAVRLDSSGVEPYLALARLYRMRGEIGRAIRVHQNLLLRRDLGPEQTVAVLADLASDFRRGGFLQRAIASYEEVLAHEPRHAQALRALVSLLADVRDYPRAIEMSRRLAKLGRDGAGDYPTEAELLVQSAEAAHSEGRSDDARKALKRALRRDGSSIRAWIALGEIEAERGRTKAALAAWSKVPDLDRRAAARVYPRIEATYASLDRARDYEGFLRGLIDEDPDDPGAVLALAGYLSSRGDTDMALAELKGLLGRRPDDREARLLLGHILLDAHRHDEVVQEFANLLDALEASSEPVIGGSLE